MLLFAFAVSTNAQTHRKWSHRKKGAVIGAGAGAAGGALISKNHRAKHAAIGAAAGAGTGYLIGRHKDKKQGTLAK